MAYLWHHNYYIFKVCNRHCLCLVDGKSGLASQTFVNLLTDVFMHDWTENNSGERRLVWSLFRHLWQCRSRQDTTVLILEQDYLYNWLGGTMNIPPHSVVYSYTDRILDKTYRNNLSWKFTWIPFHFKRILDVVLNYTTFITYICTWYMI